MSRACSSSMAALILCLTLATAQGTELEGADINIVTVDSKSPRAHEVQETLHDVQSVMSPYCGVSGILNKARNGMWESASSPRCGAVMSTNCTVSWSSIQCPSNCQYLAPSRAFACLFRCVDDTGCGDFNIDRTFPNPINHLCDVCHVKACKRCTSKHTCGECFQGFDLQDNGTKCHFTVDERLQTDLIVQVLLGLIVFLLLLAAVWGRLHDEDPGGQRRRNENNILKAREHRHLVKLHRWKSVAPGVKTPREWFGVLSTNMHVEDVIGVGLAMFYNGICFIMLVAAMFTLATAFVYKRSGMAPVLASSGMLGGLDIHPTLKAIRLSSEEPAFVVSALAGCADLSSNSGEMDHTSFHYAQVQASVLRWLFPALFVLSVLFALFQRKFRDWFDAEFHSLADYAVCVKGLPVDLTDEAQVLQWFQGRLDEKCNAAVPSSSRLIADHVSICYRFKDKSNEVNRILENWIKKREYDLGLLAGQTTCPQPHAASAPSHSRTASKSASRTLSKSTLQDVQEQSYQPVPSEEGESSGLLRDIEKDRQMVQEWFRKKELKSTGTAFVCFKLPSHKDKFLDLFNKDRTQLLKLPDSEGTVGEGYASAFDVHSEPPDILWENMGIPQAEINYNKAVGVAKIIVLVLAVQLLFVYPLNAWIVIPHVQAGQQAGGSMMILAGTVMGIVNGQLGAQIWGTAFGFGFDRQDLAFTFILVTNTAVTTVNTMLNLAITVKEVVVHTGFFDDPLSPPHATTLATESTLVHRVYEMMVPGQLFLGHVMGMVMGGIWPFLINTLLAKVIYVWRCLPDCLLRILRVFLPWAPEGLDEYPLHRAEKCFEPGGIALAWDYATLIVNPTVCFLMLFFISPYVSHMFMALLGWSFFYYAFMQFSHLRMSMAAFHSTSRLDKIALYLWGMPLSIVATAWLVWEMRAENLCKDCDVTLKWACVGGCCVLTAVAWPLLLYYSNVLFSKNGQDIDQVTEQDQDIALCEKARFYTWRNCNPIYFLKCAYCFTDAEGRDIRQDGERHPLASHRTMMELSEMRDGSSQSTPPPSQEILFYQIGKQYLFYPKEKQAVIRQKMYSFLEYETYIEGLFNFLWNPYTVTKELIGLGKKSGIADELGLGEDDDRHRLNLKARVDREFDQARVKGLEIQDAVKDLLPAPLTQFPHQH